MNSKFKLVLCKFIGKLSSNSPTNLRMNDSREMAMKLKSQMRHE